MIHETKILRISNLDRTKSSKSESDFTVHLQNRVQNVKSVVFKSVTVPNTQYNITSHNRHLLINWDGIGPTLITLQTKQYSLSELIAELESVINPTPGSGTFSITQHPDTDKLIFTSSGTAFSIAGYREGNPIAKVLGFGLWIDPTPVLTYSAPFLPDLRGLQTAYIISQALAGSYSLIDSADAKVSHVIGQVSMANTPYRSTAYYHSEAVENHDFEFPSHKDLSSIDIKLVDKLGNLLELNGIEVTITLELTY